MSATIEEIKQLAQAAYALDVKRRADALRAIEAEKQKLIDEGWERKFNVINKDLPAQLNSYVWYDKNASCDKSFPELRISGINHATIYIIVDYGKTIYRWGPRSEMSESNAWVAIHKAILLAESQRVTGETAQSRSEPPEAMRSDEATQGVVAAQEQPVSYLSEATDRYASGDMEGALAAAAIALLSSMRYRS